MMAPASGPLWANFPCWGAHFIILGRTGSSVKHRASVPSVCANELDDMEQSELALGLASCWRASVAWASARASCSIAKSPSWLAKTRTSAALRSALSDSVSPRCASIIARNAASASAKREEVSSSVKLRPPVSVLSELWCAQESETAQRHVGLDGSNTQTRAPDQNA